MRTCRIAGRRLALFVAAIVAATWFLWIRRPTAAPPREQREPAWSELAASAVLAIKAGSLAEAYHLHDEARALVTPPQPGDIRPAQTLVLLGEIHQSAGKPDEAERAFRDAVAAAEAAVGPNHPALLEILEAQANFHYYRDELDEALPIHVRMLQITEAVLADSPREVANRARNLAALYEKLGRHQEAEPLYRQTLEAGGRAGPVFQSDWIQDLITVAAFYRAWGKPDQAEPLARRALSLAEQTAGADSLDAASAMDCLAEIHLAAGKPDAAAPLAARSLGIAERYFGTESADLAPRLATMATVLAAQGKHAEADARMQRALTLIETGLGGDSPEMAAFLIRYAELMETMHRPAEAAVRRQQAERIVHPPVYEPTLAE